MPVVVSEKNKKEIKACHELIAREGGSIFSKQSTKLIKILISYMLSLERETYISFNKYLPKCILDIFFHIFQ